MTRYPPKNSGRRLQRESPRLESVLGRQKEDVKHFPTYAILTLLKYNLGVPRPFEDSLKDWSSMNAWERAKPVDDHDEDLYGPRITGIA